MKKVFHREMYSWAVAPDLADPSYTIALHVAKSELESTVASCLKKLRPYIGKYSLHVEFTEPETDPRFVLGHVGCVISVYAETKDLAAEIYSKCSL